MTPRKTSKEISDAIIAQLESSLNTTIPLLPKAFTRVLAKALGGVFVLLYQFAGFILLQLFVQTASNKPMTVGGYSITPLKLWGALVGIFQNPGTFAEYVIGISVITQTGSIVSGTRIVNTATEVVYLTIGDVALNADTVTVNVRSTVAGTKGNVDVGTSLYFVSPPDTVEKEVSVLSEATDGVEEETTDAFRQRVLDRFAARPQGGAYADYRDWASAVAGVKSVYPYSGWGTAAIPDSTSGQTFVYVESTSDTDGIPPALTNGRPPGGALLTSVFEYIEANESGLASRRPVNTYVRVLPISRKTVDVTVGGLVAEDTTAAQSQIEEALSDYMLGRAPYITGLTVPPRGDIISKMGVGAVCGQVAAANGGSIESVIVTVSGVPQDAYYLQEGEKAKLGTVSWS